VHKLRPPPLPCVGGTSDLLLHGVGLGHHGVQVVTLGDAIDHELFDLQLQVAVGVLQSPDLQEEQEEEQEEEEEEEEENITTLCLHHRSVGV